MSEWGDQWRSDHPLRSFCFCFQVLSRKFVAACFVVRHDNLRSLGQKYFLSISSHSAPQKHRAALLELPFPAFGDTLPDVVVVSCASVLSYYLRKFFFFVDICSRASWTQTFCQLARNEIHFSVFGNWRRRSAFHTCMKTLRTAPSSFQVCSSILNLMCALKFNWKYSPACC